MYSTKSSKSDIYIIIVGDTSDEFFTETGSLVKLILFIF